MGKLIQLKEITKGTYDERFIRLRDGGTYEGVISGNDAYEQTYHWNGSYYEFCSGSKEDCPKCKKGDAQVRYAFNFVERFKDYFMDPKIIELPRAVSAQIQDIYEEYGPNSLISISRTGSGVNSRYTASFKRKLERDEVAELEQIKFHDLNAIYLEKAIMAPEVKQP